MPGVRNQTIPRTRFLFAALSSLNHLRAPHFASKVSYSASPQSFVASYYLAKNADFFCNKRKKN